MPQAVLLRQRRSKALHVSTSNLAELMVLKERQDIDFKMLPIVCRIALSDLVACGPSLLYVLAFVPNPPIFGVLFETRVCLA